MHNAQGLLGRLAMAILLGGLATTAAWAQNTEEAVPLQWRDYRLIGRELPTAEGRAKVDAALVRAYDYQGAGNAARRLAGSIESPHWQVVAHTEIARNHLGRGETGLAFEAVREAVIIADRAETREADFARPVWDVAWYNAFIVLRSTNNWNDLVRITRAFPPSDTRTQLQRWQILSANHLPRYTALLNSAITRQIEGFAFASDVNNARELRELDVPTVLPILVDLGHRVAAEQLLTQWAETLLGEASASRNGDMIRIELMQLALDNGFPDPAIRAVRQLRHPAYQIAGWSILAHRLTTQYNRTDGGLFLSFAVNAAGQLGGRATAAERRYALFALGENQARLGLLADAFRTSNLFPDARDRDALLLRVGAVLIGQNRVTTAESLIPYIDQPMAKADAYIMLADIPALGASAQRRKTDVGDIDAALRRQVDAYLSSAINTGAYATIDTDQRIGGIPAAQWRVDRLARILELQITHGTLHLREQIFNRLLAVAQATQLPVLGDIQGPTLSPFDLFYAEARLTLSRAMLDEDFNTPRIQQRLGNWRNQLWTWNRDFPEAVTALRIGMLDYTIATGQLDASADYAAELASYQESTIRPQLHAIAVAATLVERDALALRIVQKITDAEARAETLQTIIRLRSQNN